MDQLVKDDFAIATFHEHGGVLSTAKALKHGIQPRTLYGLRDSGKLEQLSYGLYRLTELPPLEHPDLVTIALRIPHGVLCLISALSFHELTTEIPHEIYLALGRGTELPRVKEIPLRYFWFSSEAFNKGIEVHQLDGVSVRIYSPEKTLADLFKYRYKLGIDVALEALRFYRQQNKVKLDELLKYARICRVEKVMRPYLEALLT